MVVCSILGPKTWGYEQLLVPWLPVIEKMPLSPKYLNYSYREERGGNAPYSPILPDFNIEFIKL